MEVAKMQKYEETFNLYLENLSKKPMSIRRKNSNNCIVIVESATVDTIATIEDMVETLHLGHSVREDESKLIIAFDSRDRATQFWRKLK